MECLIGYIGIGGCSQEVPLSGLLVNDLAGISLKGIESLADGDMATYLAVWNTIQKRASIRFNQDLYKFFESKIKLLSVKQSINLGTVIGTNVTPMGASWRGFTSDLTFGTNLITASQYHAHYVQSLSFYSPINITGFELKVVDVQRATVLDTFTFDVVVGWNVKQVEKRYATNILRVVYDSTLINSAEHQLPFNSNYWGGYCGAFGYGSAQLYGTNLSSPTLYQPQGTYNTFGVSGSIAIVCTYDAAVCNNKQHFKTTWWYLLGMEVCREMLNSDNLNKWTTVKREGVKELFAGFEADYQQAMTQAVEGFPIDTADNCIDCTAQVQTWFALP